uniref:Neur_chan_LBD domain-containing protein n=1 Tax=Elaeophora elaphi TaxID=1147741 RepID=A0A158Q739_9BILA
MTACIADTVCGKETHDDNYSNQMTDEQRLLRHLLDQYEKAVRPVKNASNTVVVKMGMTMTNIFDMDEKNQVLTINAWLDQEWKDEWLVWDLEESGGIESIRVPCDLIWLPDIFTILPFADDYTIGSTHSRAILFYDGTVFWPQPAQLRSTCKTDVTYFPFDSQHCAIKFGSWTYHGVQMDITNRSANVDLSYYMESGEFDLVRAFQKRRAVKYTCCMEPYPDVTFYIHIRRKTLYYLYNVVFPCSMMSTLTLFVFILPPDSNEKVALGITVLLAFSVFMLAIAEKMPETSDSIPLIAIYLTVVMLLTSISVVMTVMVLNFHHRGPFDSPVPEWVRVLVLQKLRNFLKVHLQYPLSGKNDFLMPNGQPGEICSRKIIDFKSRNQLDNQLLWLQETEFVSVDKRLTARRTRRSIDLQVRFRKILQTFLKRQETNELYQMLTNEWRQVAYVIDRLLFGIFLICTVIITVILLVIIPIKYRSSDDLLDENSNWYV